MSATYRQLALATPEKLAKDPENRLLSRGPRFRMDAEMVRDYALAASGLLAPQIGGPSVKPYQPEGVWEAVAMVGSNTRFYKPDTGDGLYRRSLYTFWKRSAPPATMDIFNAPTRENCTVRRERTNTPLQALVTMNDRAVRGSRARAGRTRRWRTRPAFDARLDYIDDAAAGAAARASRRSRSRGAPSTTSVRYYAAHPDDAAASCWTTGATQAGPGAAAGELRRADDAGQPVAESRRGAEQMSSRILRPDDEGHYRAEALELDRAVAPRAPVGQSSARSMPRARWRWRKRAAASSPAARRGIGALALASLLGGERARAAAPAVAGSPACRISRPRRSAASTSTWWARRRRWRPSTTSRR